MNIHEKCKVLSLLKFFCRRKWVPRSHAKRTVRNSALAQKPHYPLKMSHWKVFIKQNSCNKIIQPCIQPASTSSTTQQAQICDVHRYILNYSVSVPLQTTQLHASDKRDKTKECPQMDESPRDQKEQINAVKDLSLMHTLKDTENIQKVGWWLLKMWQSPWMWHKITMLRKHDKTPGMSKRGVTLKGLSL